MSCQSLRQLQATQGACFAVPQPEAAPEAAPEADRATAVQSEPPADPALPPLSFGPENLSRATQPAGCGLIDRSDWGVLEIGGDDRLRFLHNQSTNAFQSLQPGQGCETVFVTSTARTLDLATAYVLPDRVLILLSPNRRQQIYDWLDRYIFPFDKVQLKTGDWSCLSLIGPASNALLGGLGVLGDTTTLPSQSDPDRPLHHHQIVIVGNCEVLLAQGSGLNLPGYTLLVRPADVVTVWRCLTTGSPDPTGTTITATGTQADIPHAVPLGTQDWETLRIQSGRPQPDRELTEDYNPLEAGLWQTVSFDKGCYIGQETIARLNTYKGVKQRLWGLRFQGQPEPGTILTQNGERVGKVTSVLPLESGAIGLGYIRTKAGGVGLQVQAGEIAAEVTPLTYVSHPQ